MGSTQLPGPTAASAELLSSVLDHTDNALLVLDRDQRVIYCNERYLSTWGVTRELMDTRPGIAEMLRAIGATGIYAEGEIDSLIARCLEQLRSPEPLQAIETPRRDGIAMEGFTAQLPGGGHLLAFRDVTKQRRAEQALRDERDFSESLVQRSAVATFVLSSDHRVLFWNKACEELTGLSAAEVVGTRSHWKAFYPSERPCLADLVIDQEAERGKELYPIFGASTLAPDALRAEGWYRQLGGKKRYIVFEAVPVRNADGELTAAVETIQDLTALKQAEEARSLLATAVEQAAEAIVVTDREGTIEYVNPAFTRITGYSREEVLGSDPSFLESERQHEAFNQSVRATLERGAAWKGHLVNRKKDGSLYEEETTVSPVRDDRGAVGHYVSVHRDVTVERDLERRMAESQKLEALGTLAGGIAHDFNNILTAIMGFTELALDDSQPGSRLRENLNHVYDGTRRAKELVRQILAFSRRREEEEEVGALEVAPLVEETMKFLRATLPSTLDVRWSVGTSGACVLAAPTQLHQVLLNLCTNGLQAMGTLGGLLEVSVDETELAQPSCRLAAGPYVRLVVRDTGPGIPLEIQSRIFEPFFTTKGVGEGTGMGLAVVHGIVRGLKGDVSVRSKPGEGARFEVLLPATGSVQGRPEQASPTQAPGTGRILVVDDEPAVVDLEHQVLESLGYDVVAVSDSLDALRRLEGDPTGFDLLVTDQTMPGMTGVELARRAKELRQDLPILLCTGCSPEALGENAAGLGVAAVLVKPMSRHQLACAVAEALAPDPSPAVTTH